MFQRTVRCVYFVTILLTVLVDVKGQLRTCSKIDECSCRFEDDGTVVDLKSIVNNDGLPRFADLLAADNYVYSYSPCYPFNQGTCANAAACQQTPDGGTFYLIGEQNTAAFSFDGVSVHIIYTAPGEGSGIRITDVTLNCDPTYEDPFVFAQGETATQEYAFILTHRCACPGLCSSATPTPNPNPNPNTGSDEVDGISIGTIILIVALVVLLVYIVGGIAFQKVQRKAVGMEVIPNVSFWQTLPKLIKDGFVFTFSLCRKQGYSKI